MSINAIIGDNGILNQATNAADATDIADVKEQIQVALTNYYDDLGRYTEDDVLSAVQDVLGSSATIDEADGVYTVQTAKGNTVDISDLIAGASDTTVADSGSTEDDNDSGESEDGGDSGSSEIDYDFSGSTSLITVNDGDVNITDSTLEATYDSSSASTGTIAKLGGLEYECLEVEQVRYVNYLLVYDDANNEIGAYSSLDEALAVCQDGYTVVLEGDGCLSIDSETVISKFLTIDLNGCTLTGSNLEETEFPICVSGSQVEFMDGSIKARIEVNDSGECNLTGCSLSSEYADVALTAYIGLSTVTDGELSATKCACYVDGGIVELASVSITSEDYSVFVDSGGMVTLTDCNLESDSYGIYITNAGEVTSTANTITSSYGIYVAYGGVDITDDTITSDYSFYITDGYVSVVGGYYEGDVYAPIGCLVITSGDFSVDVSKWYAD